MIDGVRIEKIGKSEYAPWLLERHYARRLCSVIHAFGAYRDNGLLGVITYGSPPSPHLCRGICGPEWSKNILELNRLCCESIPNLPSLIVGQTLRLLPRPSIVVSFADTAQGHVGYVYQATNWVYTGLSAKRTDWAIKGMDMRHTRSLTSLYTAAQLREKYGEDFYLEPRPRKHRYLFFVGSKTQRKAMKSALRYKVEPYPKGDTRRYDASPKDSAG